MTRRGTPDARGGTIMKSPIFLALALAAPLVGCMDSVADELANDDVTDGDGKADESASPTHTFYFVQPDLRLCVAPHCGGYFYSLANGNKTTCLDGSKHERCYAASADWD